MSRTPSTATRSPSSAARGKITRVPDWRVRLYAALEGHRGHAFQWGSHDCALLAADAVLAMTGVDLAAPFRGRYATLIGARRAMHAAGYDDQVAIAAAQFREIHPAYAQVGDLAVVPNDDGWEALGVVTGPVIQVFARDGLAAWPLDRATRAFKVG